MILGTSEAAGLARRLSKNGLYNAYVTSQRFRKLYNSSATFVSMVTCKFLSLQLQGPRTQSFLLALREGLAKGQHDFMQSSLRDTVQLDMCARVCVWSCFGNQTLQAD